MTDTLYQFYRGLHGRGLTQKKLAALAGTGRAHLCEVLNNKPGHGHFTRRRLFPHLTGEEVRLLGWSGEYDLWRAQKKPSSTGNFVPISA